MDLQAPLPPPPPPPAMMPNMTMANHQNHHQALLNLNNTRNMSDRSQLLLEIERGTPLKKVAHSQKGLNTRSMNQLKQISSSNECNGIDNNNYSEDPMNPIKNQLQAELSTTLNRRQNGGNKKPTYVTPKNTTINAINNQLRELHNNAQVVSSPPVTNGHHTTSIPDATQTKQPTVAAAHANTDKEEKPKLLISHGKPNFKISSNSTTSKKLLEKKDENMADNELIGTLRRRLKSMESLDEIDPIGKCNATTVTIVPPKPVLEPKRSAPLMEPMKSVPEPQKIVREPNVPRIETNGIPKAPNTPPLFYKASVKNFSNATNDISSSDGKNEIKQTIRRLKSVELLEQNEKSMEEKTELNDIQRRIQNLKTVEINKLNSASNGFTAETHTTNEQHNIETVSVRSTTKTTRTTTTTETDCFQSSPILPRRAQLFKQQQNLANSKITSPTIHHINNGTLNYKVKPITSFSRDLQLTPNRYPEKIQVTKTLSSSSEPEPVFFSDIKFIINSNGEVVRS